MLDNKLCAKAAIIFLWLSVWRSAAWLVYNVVGYNAAHHPATAFVVAVGIIVMVGSTATFLAWFYRAYKNLDLAGVNTLYAPGWAIGSFFVPLLNLIRPYRIMEEIWLENAGRLNDPNSTESPAEEQPGALLKWWWGCKLLSLMSIFTNHKTGLRDFGAIIAPAREICVWFGSLFTLLAAIFALRVIKKISTFEKAVFEKHQNEA
jgi:hypothetical protein